MSERSERELRRQLKNEIHAHRCTRDELDRVWRLVPTNYISLMGVYPPLRKLLSVLVDAADLQDPARGAPIEDTMRTEFVHTGEQASSSSTEAGVMTHRRHRAAVEEITKQIDRLADSLSNLVPGPGWEYDPPSSRCENCDRPIAQPTRGRPRKWCSERCRRLMTEKTIS
jgi:hypothetical protein